MADNETTGTNKAVATRKITNSGDADQNVQLVCPVSMEGSEGSWTLRDRPDTQDTGLFVPANAFGSGNTPADAVESVFYSDPSGNLATRGQTLTDEGSFRDDFPGSALATALGANPTFTNGGTTVTISSGFLAAVRAGMYIKRDGDGESAWARVDSVDSDTSLTLETAYTGTSGSAASSTSWYKTTTTGSGTSVTVGSSRLNVLTGTTSGDAKYVHRLADFCPMIAQFLQLNVSQRIANQLCAIGLRDSLSSPSNRAEVQFSGTTNTTVDFVTGGNDSATTTSTTCTLPNGLTTATNADYRIEVSRDRASLLVNNTLLATHTLKIPDPYKELEQFVLGSNTGTAGGTTTISCDGESLSNDNHMMVINPIFSTPVIVLPPQPERIQVTSAGLTTATTAYSISDQVGTQFTLPNAARVAGGGGYITGVRLLDLQDIIGAYDVVFFRASGTPASDNAAFSISTTDIVNLIDIVQLAGAFDLGSTRVASSGSIRVPYDCGTGTALYAWLITRTAHTFFSGGATQLRLIVYLEK